MRASSKSHPAFLAWSHVNARIPARSRPSLVAASLTSLVLVVLLGIAVHVGWQDTAVLDGPASSMRDWAADRPGAEALLLRVETVLGYDGMTVATLLLTGFLLVRRRVRAALVVLAVMWTTKELTQVGKALFGRERPSWQEADHFLQSGSYPSAHASTVAAFTGLVIALTILGTRRRATRWVVGGAAVVPLLAVCADRLLLGRHYPSDLLGGVLLAAGVVLAGVALLQPLPVPAEVEEAVPAPVRQPASAGR